MQQWVDFMSKSYIDSVGPEVKVFKMDKTETQLDELYGESSQGRIYLPPFPIRTIYDSNKWVGFLDAGGYQEQEETLTMMINFGNMVKKITDLRKKHVAELYISYAGKGTPFVEKVDSVLILYVNNKVHLTIDLTNNLFSTIRKLASRIDMYTNWSCKIEGENDLSVNLIDFNKTSFNQRETMIYTIDQTYKNITDVIEMGDTILTSRYRLYEVTSAAPAGDFGWNYSLWQLGLELASPDRFNLPGNYIEQMRDNQHGLTKTKTE